MFCEVRRWVYVEVRPIQEAIVNIKQRLQALEGQVGETVARTILIEEKGNEKSSVVETLKDGVTRVIAKLVEAEQKFELTGSRRVEKIDDTNGSEEGS